MVDRCRVRRFCRMLFAGGMLQEAGNGAGGGFARSDCRLVRPVDQFDQHFWDFWKPENWISSPIEAGHYRVVKLDFFFEASARRLNHIALDLRLDRLRIGRPPRA